MRGVDESTRSLRVRVASAPENAPDVLGESRASEGTLTFTPRFAFQPGLTYCVSIDGAAEPAREFSLPAAVVESRVKLHAVSPGAARVPSNLLKFYLHFSGPMRRGEAYEHVRLREANGEVVAGAFIEIEPELWNSDRTRLTLLIDPGRIKRGLLLHEELGPVLYPDRNYVLEVDATWRDDRGASLVAGHEHPFQTLGADVSCPIPENWQLAPPSAGSRDALVVQFDEALDRALIERLLWIQRANGEPVEGNGWIREDQSAWHFVPDGTWRNEVHELVIPALIEDLAGNSVGRPFELESGEMSEWEQMPVHVGFTPR